MYPNLSPERIRIVKNGVELSRFSFDAEARKLVRGELGLEDAFVVGHVGRFAYQKNHDFLIDAFALIRERVPEARLLLVGEGVLFEQTRQRAARLGLEQSVIFYGASRDVGALMQAMDLFALPSHFEGLPVVGVEAQAAGLPVAFSDQVTRQARLTGRVWFLPIARGSQSKWAELARVVASKGAGDRASACEQVRRAGFTIQDTVRAFLELYGTSEGGGTT